MWLTSDVKSYVLAIRGEYAVLSLSFAVNIKQYISSQSCNNTYFYLTVRPIEKFISGCDLFSLINLFPQRRRVWWRGIVMNMASPTLMIIRTALLMMMMMVVYQVGSSVAMVLVE